MYFYLLMFPSVVFVLYMLCRIRRIKKHDRVLYGFCQVRRDVMGFLRENGHGITKSDYLAAKCLLNALEVAIHKYETCKLTAFNLRALAKFLKKTKKNAENFERVHVRRQELVRAHINFRMSLVMAFMAYTPLIKYEIMMRLVLLMFAGLAKSGIKIFVVGYENLCWLNNENLCLSGRNNQQAAY